MAKGRWGGKDANDESAENNPENDGGDSGTKPSGEGSSAASDEGESTNEDEGTPAKEQSSDFGNFGVFDEPSSKEESPDEKGKGKDADADLENFFAREERERAASEAKELEEKKRADREAAERNARFKEMGDELDLPDLESDRLYVMFYGKPQTGKSVILSGLLYFLQTDPSITWNLDKAGMDHSSERKLSELRGSIRKRKFVQSTKFLGGSDKVWELKGELIPKNKKLPPLKLCFLELAGEDLRSIMVEDSNFNGELDLRIRHYLDSWEKPDNMCFLMVAPCNEAEDNEEALLDMFTYMDTKQMGSAPSIVMLSKWDLLDEEGNRPGELRRILADEMPMAWQQIQSENRDVATMRFSIGAAEKGSDFFTYAPKDSKAMSRRLYQIGTGLQRDPWTHQAPGFFKRLFSK